MTLALLGLLAASAWGATKVKLASEADHINYSIGYQMGTDFKNQGWELKPEAMVQGIQDAINGIEPLLSDDLMKATLAEMKRKLMHTQQQNAIDYQLASQKFMKENAGKEGVVVLPSGVQ
jgi:FKBP-type peptidyl-prolyl cis-trans isomerase FklB